MSSLILTIDNAVEDTTIIDRLYDIMVGEGVSIGVEPPNFIFKDDLDYNPEKNELDNLLRKIIKEVWMKEAHFLIKDRMDELVGFECWNNNLPNDSQVKSLAGGNAGLNYHLDKDEVAYSERNELRLPMFATAFYIGPKEGLNGGELMVNVRGQEHYREYSGGLIDYNDEENWVRIPFRYNRMVIFDSNYPHFVMPIIATPNGEKRCSVAINAWHTEIGK
jgi:hypothetical protein